MQFFDILLLGPSFIVLRYTTDGKCRMSLECSLLLILMKKLFVVIVPQKSQVNRIFEWRMNMMNMFYSKTNNIKRTFMTLQLFNRIYIFIMFINIKFNQQTNAYFSLSNGRTKFIPHIISLRQIMVDDYLSYHLSKIHDFHHLWH